MLGRDKNRGTAGFMGVAPPETKGNGRPAPAEVLEPRVPTVTEAPKPAGEDTGSPRLLYWLLALSLFLVLGGGLLAAFTQTNGFTVTIKDVRFMGSGGKEMSALLYIPPGVTAKNPAPGILAVHGYINSRETQDGFAIEFARRGYVVLAMDQTGHGYSDGPAFANGFGGPDGLAYLRSLDMVDKTNIGMEGHSMGGWTDLAAAGVFSTSYQSIVLEGSSTGAPFAAEGTTTWPRNLAVVFSKMDEFSPLMWGVGKGTDVVNSPKLQAVFGTNQPIQIGKIYGSIADGTARVLYQPDGTHPWDHFNNVAIGNSVDWFQQTLKGGNSLPPSDQIWLWKEIGTFIALIGMVMFLFPLGGLLLKTGLFRELNAATPKWKGMPMPNWWIGAAIAIAVPAITFFHFQHWTSDATGFFPPSAFWPQSITTGIMGWAVGNAAITLVLFLAWHFLLNRRAGAVAANYGVTWVDGFNWRKLGKSALLAISLVTAGYSLLLISDFAFKTDFRLWVLAFKAMDPLQFRIFLTYLIPFTIYFVILGLALHGQLRPGGSKGVTVGLGREMLINVGLAAGGIFILEIAQYIPLFLGGTLWNSGEPLLTIVGIQFIPILAIVALVSTYFYRKTGNVYVGAFMNALIVTWYIVAGQATQFAL